MSASKLVRPDIEYKESYIEALREFRDEGRYEYLDPALLTIDFENFVHILNTERGYAHQPYQEWVEVVPETVTWLVKDETFIGTMEIRHRLNWHLEKWGGHLHFTIRPSMRNNGFGRKILIKSIPIANYLGIENALLTIDPENKAAIRIAETVGAKLEDKLPETEKFPERLRYWLDCT